MRLPRALARFNRVVTNRVQGLWAPYLPPWIMVLHIGRRSRRSLRTPVMGAIHGDQIVIPLLYGPDSDWVRNLLAAGQGDVIRLGRTRPIDRLELVTRSDAGRLPLVARILTRTADHLPIAHIS
jgi:deazaflavin-dependent oxidoreductase (nitroreductase family)